MVSEALGVPTRRAPWASPLLWGPSPEGTQGRGRETEWMPEGPSALRIFRQYVSEIRAVLLDLGLPGMTGQEVFREAVEGYGRDSKGGNA